VTNVFDQWRVVTVPFPFADGPQTKYRPAAVLSGRSFNESGSTVMAMITSAQRSRWPGDVLLDHESAGLQKPRFLRLKLFTIDNRLIQTELGTISEKDIHRIVREFRRLLPCAARPTHDRRVRRTRAVATRP
jgi:mRNA interferase MazF